MTEEAPDKFDVATALDEYAAWTDTTAVYPIETESVYLALGLNEELGELGAAISALQQARIGSYSSLSSDERKEAGDVLWYACRYATRVLKTSPSELLNCAKGSSLVVYDRDAARAASVLAGVEKKLLRGDKVTTKSMAIAMFSIMTILLYLARRSDIAEIISENKEKLYSRKERGVLKGSGDDR